MSYFLLFWFYLQTSLCTDNLCGIVDNTTVSLVFNFGGPGESGVGNLLQRAPDLAEIFGTTVNLVSFDPRGVNNTGPQLDCFPPGDQAVRNQFDTTFFRIVPDADNGASAMQYYMAKAWGEWCNSEHGGSAVGGPSGLGKYTGSPAVARDMLAYVEAQAAASGKDKGEAQLWFVGYSYGTIIGATFATLFPDRIGRMILDGVVDSEDYYSGANKKGLVTADEAVSRCK